MMNTEEPKDARLTPAFNALRAALDAQHTPPGVEQELMAAFARRHRKPRWYQGLSTGQWGIAGSLGGAALAMTIFLLSGHVPQPMDQRAKVLASMDQGAPFIALSSIQRIEQEPEPRLVETEVARIALVSLGVPVTPENAGDQVRAEMLIGADGQPLALRLSKL